MMNVNSQTQEVVRPAVSHGSKDIDCSKLIEKSSLDLSVEAKEILNQRVFSKERVDAVIKRQKLQTTIITTNVNVPVEVVEEAQEPIVGKSETPTDVEVVAPLATIIKSNWQIVAEALKANDGLAEINSKLTRVTILGCIGDDVVILPTKTIKAKDKFMWKAELKALKLDGNIVLESDKVLGKLDVVTTSADVEEMVSVYNTTVDVDNQIVGFIQI